MSKHEADVADMQCWIFRMAQTQWNKSPKACARIFQDNNIFDYISDCYDVLHLSSYDCALHDVEELLKNRGVTV